MMLLCEFKGHITSDTLHIDKEQFAPGMWAGTEGLIIEVRHVHKVSKVDLENRIVTIEPWTQVYSIDHMHIVDARDIDFT